MLRTNQPISRRAQLLGTFHQFNHVGLAVGYIHQTRLRQLGRHPGYVLITFYPARTFLLRLCFICRHVATFLACPHMNIDHTKRLPLRCGCIRRMQVHPTPPFIIQSPQTTDVLCIEIQFGRIFQTQNHRMSSHALLCFGLMRPHDLAPMNVLIGEKSVGRLRLCPPIARHRNTRRWLGHQLIR